MSLEKDAFRNSAGDSRFVSGAVEVGLSLPSFSCPFHVKNGLLQKVFQVWTKNYNRCDTGGVMSLGNLQRSICILNCLTLLKASPLSKIMLIASSGIQESLNAAGPSWHFMTENHKARLNSVSRIYALWNKLKKFLTRQLQSNQPFKHSG